MMRIKCIRNITANCISGFLVKFFTPDLIRMIKHIIFTCLFTLISLSLSSQYNFKTAFVITNSGDTLHGQVDYRSPQLNAQNCRFRASVNDSIRTYLPAEIAAYRLTNEGVYYVSREITIDSVKTTVFLEYLVDGVKNLYYFHDGREYFFFENAAGDLWMISRGEDIRRGNYMYPDTRYKGMLMYHFNEFPTVVNLSKNAVFDKKSMIRVAREYHRVVCGDSIECIVFENNYKLPLIKIGFNIAAGVDFNHLMFIPSGELNTPVNALSISPTFSFETMFSSPRNNPNFGAFVYGAYSKLKGSRDFVNKYSVIERLNTYHYTGDKVWGGAGLRYIFMTEKAFFRNFRLAVDLSVFRQWIVNADGYSEYLDPVTQNIIKVVGFNVPQLNWNGLQLGLGLDYKLSQNTYLSLKGGFSKSYGAFDSKMSNDSQFCRIGFSF